MAKTIPLEELTPDTRKVLEELFSAEVPMTPEEKAELRAAVVEGEADYTAGNFLTLEEFKDKHSAKLRGAKE